MAPYISCILYISLQLTTRFLPLLLRSPTPAILSGLCCPCQFSLKVPPSVLPHCSRPARLACMKKPAARRSSAGLVARPHSAETISPLLIQSQLIFFFAPSALSSRVADIVAFHRSAESSPVCAWCKNLSHSQSAWRVDHVYNDAPAGAGPAGFSVSAIATPVASRTAGSFGRIG